MGSEGRESGPLAVFLLHRWAVRKLLLLLSLCAVAAGFAPGRAAATDACGRPERTTTGSTRRDRAWRDIFARPGTILAVSTGDFPAQVRAARCAHHLLGHVPERAGGDADRAGHPRSSIARANTLFEYAAQQSSCSTPWIALNELFGASLQTPWSTRTRSTARTSSTYLQTLAARAPAVPAREQRAVHGREAAAWWQQVAAVADIVRETYFSAKMLDAQGPVVGNRTLRARRCGPPSAAFSRSGFRRRGSASCSVPDATAGRRAAPPQADAGLARRREMAGARRTAGRGRAQISSIWSWGWGPWTKPEQLPRKAAAACCLSGRGRTLFVTLSARLSHPLEHVADSLAQLVSP